MIIKFCLVFPKIFLLHKVVRDAKKVEKHCSRGTRSSSKRSNATVKAAMARLCLQQAEEAFRLEKVQMEAKERRKRLNVRNSNDVKKSNVGERKNSVKSSVGERKSSAKKNVIEK